MANISLSNPQNITKLVCNSSPPLGGSLNLSFFSNIQEFDATQNEIESVQGLNKLSSIEKCDLRDNLINEKLENVWGMTSLKNFILRNNSYFGDIPSFVSNSLLETLDLSNNNFFGRLPYLAENINLTTLDLSNNNFIEKPNLQVLTIEKNVGMGTFAPGDIIFQDQSDGSVTKGQVIRVDDNGTKEDLFVDHISNNETNANFNIGNNFSDIYTGTSPMDVLHEFNVEFNTNNELVIDGVVLSNITLNRNRKYIFTSTDISNLDFLLNNSLYNDGIKILSSNSPYSFQFFVPNDAPSSLTYQTNNDPSTGANIFISDPITTTGITASVPLTNITNKLDYIPSSLTFLDISGCSLNADAVNTILSSIVATGSTGGTLFLSGGSNSPPSGGTTNPDYVELTNNRNWTVNINTP